MVGVKELRQPPVGGPGLGKGRVGRDTQDRVRIPCHHARGYCSDHPEPRPLARVHAPAVGTGQWQIKPATRTPAPRPGPSPWHESVSVPWRARILAWRSGHGSDPTPTDLPLACSLARSAPGILLLVLAPSWRSATTVPCGDGWKREAWPTPAMSSPLS